LLARHLDPSSLRLVVLFASIAGRFGNAGQSDYAAGNELMNRWACLLDRQWPDTRVVAINWGPWTGIGMASEAVNQRFSAQGIIPIEASAGARFLLDESLYGRIAEVIAGEGPWAEQSRHRHVPG
jgi:hypothetical protein